jgi:hypothetical protein
MRIGITSREYLIMPTAIPSSCCSTLRSSAGMESRSSTFNAGGTIAAKKSCALVGWLDEDLTRNGEEFVILDELAASHVKASSCQA